MIYRKRAKWFIFFVLSLSFNISSALYITEIHYHPTAGVLLDGDLFEFIELKNTGSQALDISGYSFKTGLTYTFSSGSNIAPGAFVVLASDSVNFKSRYGFSPNGQFIGNLNNSGEKITLCKSTTSEEIVDQVSYKDETPWPVEPDGTGRSLVAAKTDRSGDPDQPSTWRASTNINGSPGADDPEGSLKVLINEIKTNAELPYRDFIELYNEGSATVDISGWFLTDNRKKPKKFKIPTNTTIPAGGYRVFYDSTYNANPEDTTGVAFSSHGEDAFIFAADTQGNLTGYSQGFSFGEIEKNLSFGRYVTSTGETHFITQTESSPGAANVGPRIGKVIITEIMYGGTDGVDYLELKNISGDTVYLYDRDSVANSWKVNGIGFTFPSLTKINPGQIMLLVDDTITITAFRTKYNLASDVPVFSYSGGLSDNGETIELQKPELPYMGDTSRIVPYMIIDAVDYGSLAPWPTDAQRTGKSVQRISASAYGNDPTNWKSDQPSPGGYSTPVIQPVFLAHSRNSQVTVDANRANHTSSIHLFLPKAQMVSIDLFDCNGRLYANIMRRQLQSGSHIEQFNTAKFCNKLLFLKVTASGKTLYTGKVTISN